MNISPDQIESLIKSCIFAVGIVGSFFISVVIIMLFIAVVIRRFSDYDYNKNKEKYK